jgi:hypothetical protein
VWGGVALFCWLVAVYLAVAPVRIEGSTCDERPVPAALAGDPENGCTFRSAKRVGALVVWVLLTAPVTVMFVVQPRAPRDTDSVGD